MKKIKWILSLLYVMFGGCMIANSITAFKSLKEDLKAFNFWNSTIGLTLKIWIGFGMILPVVCTFMIILWKILGQKMSYSFFDTIGKLWSGFYYNGYLLDVVAWRWQILFMIFCFLFVISQKD